MIPKLTWGSDAYRAMAYDYGPGRKNEHVNARRVAGNAPGRSWKLRARSFQKHVAAHQKKGEKDVLRVALACAPEDRVMADGEWAVIASSFVSRFGMGECYWEAVRHDDRHIHVTISQRDFGGVRVRDSFTKRRAIALCRDLEREHDLVDASSRVGSNRSGVDRGIGERGGVSERDWIRARIDAAFAAGKGLEGVRECGVNVVLHTASTGRVSGVKFSRPPVEGGEVYWFRGGQLGKNYSYGGLNKRGLQHGIDATEYNRFKALEYARKRQLKRASRERETHDWER